MNELLRPKGKYQWSPPNFKRLETVLYKGFRCVILNVRTHYDDNGKCEHIYHMRREGVFVHFRNIPERLIFKVK